jgi:glycine/D-amino acid oxidase-like deaminating enzyme
MNKVLIIGGGISGLSMAWALEQQQIDYMLADPGTGGHASVVAAGLMNPVTGRQYKLQPMVEVCWEAAANCYTWWSEVTGHALVRPMDIHRLHRSEAAREQWRSNALPLAGSWAEDLPDERIDHNSYQAGFGVVWVHHGHIVTTGKLYVEAIRYLRNAGKLLETDISPEVLQQGPPFTAGGITFDAVIDASGIAAAANPVWQNIPFRYNKGEALLIKAIELPEDRVITRNVILVPQGSAHFWAGSHNHWDDRNPGPTAEGLDKLSADITATIRVPFEIIRHRAAIRPVIQDRKPVSGSHPAISHLHILNGMGTKGYSLAPYHARLLAAHIAEDTALPAATDVKRFY